MGEYAADGKSEDEGARERAGRVQVYKSTKVPTNLTLSSPIHPPTQTSIF